MVVGVGVFGVRVVVGWENSVLACCNVSLMIFLRYLFVFVS